MDISDWKYAGEGGRHAVFTYEGNASEKWSGRVLRIKKDDLARSGSDVAAGARAPAEVLPADKGKELSYLVEVVSPFLNSYVDIPDVVHLKWDFVALLRQNALASDEIPLCRRKDWTASTADKDDAFPSYVVAYLLSNYKNMSGNLPALSCEIKPKAGYKAFSPLVRPEHRAKFSHTRFEINEYLRCNGYISKPWVTHSDQMLSRYNPLDLYSGDATRIQCALEALFESPQNKMRVWFDDKLVIGGFESECTRGNVYASALHQIFGEEVNDECARSEFCMLLTRVMTQVLLHESLLARLQEVQRLDVVDADGAILLYEQLLNLCGEAAVDYLDAPSPLGYGVVDKPAILANSPFQVPLIRPHLVNLCREIQTFSERLSDANIMLTDDDFDRAHGSASRKLNALSAEACRFLVQNWLLSLVACDVSFFFTISPLKSEEELFEHGIEVGDIFSHDDGQISVRAQGIGTPGVVIWNLPAARKRVWVYSLKVVDCDKKPANKLKTRYKKEDPIQYFPSSPS